MFYPALQYYVANIESDFHTIPGKRIDIIETLGDYIHKSLRGRDSSELIFICTQNSRRSQLGQVWAHTASLYYGIENILTYSGGTESSAFNPRALAAVEKAGFYIEKAGCTVANPQYIIKATASEAGILMYSKKYDDPTNPTTGFCAIMVCSDADKACPFISGADERISIPYEDPKTFDGTELEASKYDERCRQFAIELFYLFNFVRKQS